MMMFGLPFRGWYGLTPKIRNKQVDPYLVLLFNEQPIVYKILFQKLCLQFTTSLQADRITITYFGLKVKTHNKGPC
jgi:hypothetical protein